MINWTLLEPSIGELTETVDGPEWAKAKFDAMNVLKMQNAEITDEAVIELAINPQLEVIFRNGVKKFNLIPMTKPKVDVTENDNNGVDVSIRFAVRPDVKVGDIRGIHYKVADVEVTEKDIEDGIKIYQESKATLVEKDGPAEMGDAVTVDYTGYIDGKEFEFGSEEDAVIVIGNNMFAHGFEEGLTGTKAGDVLDIPVTFPDDYGAEELNGKEAVFKTKVKKVQTKTIPEVTEDFIKSLKLDDVRTMEEFRLHVKKTVAKAMRLRNVQEAEAKMIDELLAITEVEIPGPIVEAEIGNTLTKMNEELTQQGSSLISYLKVKGQSAEEFIKELWPAAERTVKSSLALEQIGQDHKLNPTNAEIEGEYKSLALRYKADVNEVKKSVPVDQLSYELLISKAMDFLKKQ